jgi:hypothetical protein
MRLSSLSCKERCTGIWIIVCKIWKLARVNETKRSERARRYRKKRNDAKRRRIQNSDGLFPSLTLLYTSKNRLSSSFLSYHISPIIVMQESTEEAEASISVENEGEDPNLNVTFALCRKAAKRTLPWDLVGEELNLMPSLPQAEDIPATKKPRLEEPFSASSTDEAAIKISSRDTAVSLPADADANHVDVDADANPVTVTQAKGRWTPAEDEKLNSAVTSTCKKKCGKESRPYWAAVAALVPGRSKKQCCKRWTDVLDPSIGRASERMSWTAVDDIKLKDVVQTHRGKTWEEIAALVPGRTRSQCRSRWCTILDPNIDRANQRTGKWVDDEDIKLKDAVQTYGVKNWSAIAALVPGRTKNQCSQRWHNTLNPSIAVANSRTGIWAEDEDSKLKDAVQRHAAKNWAAIAAVVPGRTKNQCSHRWHNTLNPSIDRTKGREGKWTAVENSKLKDGVHTHGGKNWGAIAALVPGRTTNQCRSRWQSLQLSPK